MLRVNRQLAGRVGRGLLVLAILVGIVSQSGLALGQVERGATLTVLRGVVSVVRRDGSIVSPAVSGQVLGIGDHVATVARSAALVTFFDGSEVELGADTSIAIHELQADSSGQITILIENVLGSTVSRIVTFVLDGSSYRILAGGTVTEVHGTTIGHRIDADGNVTVYLIESNGEVTFPNTEHRLQNGEACTLSSSGDLVCQQANGQDVWNTLSDGVFGNQTGGTGNPGAATGSGGSNADRHKDDTEKKSTPVTATATATPTGTLAPSATSTLTSVPTSVPTRSVTVTPTVTATVTVTPTATLTVTPTVTSTASPTVTPSPTVICECEPTPIPG